MELLLSIVSCPSMCVEQGQGQGHDSLWIVHYGSNWTRRLALALFLLNQINLHPLNSQGNHSIPMHLCEGAER